MPKHKDLKRRVRSRMQKTGESYTTARLRLLEKKKQAPPAVDHAARAGMSDEAVRAATGKSWSEWTAALDAMGAAARPHREIARHVHDVHGVPRWWTQTVTVGYERIRGLREVGQQRGGTYEASKSKTFPVPVARLYRACAGARARARWLEGLEPVVRRVTPEKTLRLTWENGTSVELYFVAKGPAKSQLAVQHRKLATKADSERMKRFWAERLGALAQSLEPGPRRKKTG